MHPAQDLATPTGNPVRSLSTGTVVFSGWSNEGYGYMVKIRYWDGTVSWMAHNSRLLVASARRSIPARRSPTAATPATRPDRTCTSRSTRRRWPGGSRTLPSPPGLAAVRGVYSLSRMRQ